MKTFLGKKWGRLPIGIIGAVMAVLLIATSVFAAYAVITGTTTVDVNESITARYSDGGTWTNVPNGFTLPLGSYYPGEEDTGWYEIHNAASVVTPVAITISNVPAGWTLVGDTGITLTQSGGSTWWTYSGTVNVPAVGFSEFQITMTVPFDADPTGIYAFNYVIARG